MGETTNLNWLARFLPSTVSRHFERVLPFLFKKTQLVPFDSELNMKPSPTSIGSMYVISYLPTFFCTNKNQETNKNIQVYINIKGKMWVPLGEYPSSRSQNITPYCPIQPLYNPYIGGICGYISRVLSQGYPTFPFDNIPVPLGILLGIHCLGIRPIQGQNLNDVSSQGKQTLEDMGIVWEAYHKGVPLLGVPENPIDWGMKQLELGIVVVVHHPFPIPSMEGDCYPSYRHL